MDSYQVTYFCDPCKFTGKREKAKGFCKKCEGNLCKECIKAHKKSRETGNHVITMIVKSDAAGGDSLQQKEQACSEHSKVWESFCDEHDVLCCCECVAQRHSECGSLVPLQRAAIGVHQSDLVGTTSKNMQNLISKFEKTLREEKIRCHSVEAQGKALEQTVHDFRKDVNKLLDKLQASVLLKRDEVCKQEKSAINERIDVCNSVLPVLSKSGNELNKLSVNEQQAFVTVKQSSALTRQYEDVHGELEDNQSKFSLKFLPNQTFVKALDSLGSIVLRSTIQPTTPEVNGRHSTERKLVQEREVDVHADTDSTVSTITGCTYLDDGRLVMADEANRCIKVLNPELKMTISFALDVAPWDLVAVATHDVAVRSSFSDKNDQEAKTIQILEIGTDSVKQKSKFSVDGKPKAIKYLKPYLYIALLHKKGTYLLVTDTHGRVCKTIRPKNGSLDQPEYICVVPSSKLIYISDFEKGILALDNNGEVLFRFRDSHVTEYGGITLDDNEDLYVCAGKPYGIYSVVKGQSNLVPLVTWSKGTIDPQSVLFNRSNKTFLVTCCNSDTAYIFRYSA